MSREGFQWITSIKSIKKEKQSVSIFEKHFEKKRKYLKYYCKSPSNLYVIRKLKFLFINLVFIQKLIINQGKESNCISHLVYYFILAHMQLCGSEILTEDSLTLTLMPYFFWWCYPLALLSFLICPCNEPLVGGFQTEWS